MLYSVAAVLLAAPAMAVAEVVKAQVSREAAAAANSFAAIARDLKGKLQAELDPEPDIVLVKIHLQLKMRVNNGLLETPQGIRRYPRERDFEKYSASAAAEILRKIIKLPPGKPRMSFVEGRGLNDVFERTTVRMARKMPVVRGLSRVPDPPPMGPDEVSFLPGSARP